MTTLTEPRVASVEEIRALFPSLERIHAGYPVGYFDGPGGTQVPTSVVDAIVDYFYHHTGNRGWGYPTSVETDEMVAQARLAMADLLGCGPDDVAFGPNMTSLTFHLSRTLGRRFRPGDEIIVTRLDHFGNVSPWKSLEQDRGVVVKEVPFHPEDGTLDTDAYEKLLSSRTKLVALGWASNALGTISDLPPMLAKAKAVGALTFVDGVHSVTHVLPSARAMGCDFLVCSPYKFYGPHAGVLYCPKELMEELDPPRLSCAPQAAPERFETGTASHEDMPGMTATVDFLAGLAAEGETRRERLENAYEGLHQRSDELITRLWRGLESIPKVRLFGPPPGKPRTPTISFVVDGHHSRMVAEHLWSRFGLFLSSGAFYAANVPGDLGLSGPLVRAGCMAYTTQEEVDRLIGGVEDFVKVKGS
ncbi:MAG TPA: cysteine desulfurase-like protein [Longimicrobiales bacterium]|nr:cysteine desulfurase-like protein [Longimicrobiales bacterium]